MQRKEQQRYEQSKDKKSTSSNQFNETVSSKLFSMTGLRMFQAKFMEELHEAPIPTNTIARMDPLDSQKRVVRK